MSGPAPAVYVVLMALTWAAHFLGAAYVLAGTGWLAARSLRPGGEASAPTERVLRDWLPFVLSAAITVGVAPLLFVQVLHPRAFYTANLLSFWSWLAILPALVAGFYLLYVLKSGVDAGRSAAFRVGVPWAALLCFAYVGLAWTRNHLLSLAGQEAWVAARPGVLPDGAGLARLALWFGCAPPLWATVVLYQLHHGPTSCADLAPERLERAARRLAPAALAGLALAALGGALHVGLRGVPAGGAPRVLVLAGTGAGSAALALQAAGWIAVARGGPGPARTRAALGVGALALLVGLASLREGLRLGSLDLAAWSTRVREAATGEGLALFLVLAAAVAALLAWVARAVRTSATRPAPPGATGQQVGPR